MAHLTCKHVLKVQNVVYANPDGEVRPKRDHKPSSLSLILVHLPLSEQTCFESGMGCTLIVMVNS